MYVFYFPLVNKNGVKTWAMQSLCGWVQMSFSRIETVAAVAAALGYKTNINSFSIHLRVSILLCANAPESTSIRTPAGDSCTLVLPPAPRSGGCKEYPIGNPTLPSDKYPGALWMTSNFSSLIWAIMRLFPQHWSPVQSSWRSPSRMDVARGCWRNWDIANLPSQVHGGKARVSTDVKCCFHILITLCSPVGL